MIQWKLCTLSGYANKHSDHLSFPLTFLQKRMKRELSDVRIRKFELRIDCDDISQEQDGADGWGNKQALMTYLGARLSLRRLAFQFGDAIYSAVYVIIGMTGNPLCPDDAEVELEYQYQDRS